MPDPFPYRRPLSHPPTDDEEGVPLIDHLHDVASRATDVSPNTTTPGGTPVPKLAYIVGLLHDFGKLTTHFQQYLAGTRPSDTQTHHAQLGAALTIYTLTESPEFDVTDALIGFTAVAKHHGRLPNVVDDAVGINSFFDRHHDHLLDHATNVHTHAPDLAQHILNQTNTNATYEGFLHALQTETLTDTLDAEYTGQMFTSGGNAVEPTAHDALLALWSSLLLADKSTAANIPQDALHATPFDPDCIQRHIESLWANSDEWDADTQKLNTARNNARETAVETALTLPTDGAVATLTLPTGLGKTFAGTHAALTHLTKKRNAGYPSRLVYALPFTSIIDQTQTIFEDVFNADPASSDLTIHHHLAETATHTTPSTDTDAFAARDYLLGETWRAGTILTTYVQLLESLVAPRNSQALKLSSLYGSVIILDEPQSLPTTWWPLFRRLTHVLTEQFDATLILMTATQPRILQDDFTPTELIPDATAYFTEFERVTYQIDNSIHPDTDQLSPQTAGNHLAEEFTTGTDSVLSITNTITSTRALYDHTVTALADTHTPLHITDLYHTHLTNGATDPIQATIDTLQSTANNTEHPVAVCQLTTRQPPRTRKHLLDILTTLTQTELPVLLCSTQLIEAGVDISFEAVFRDLAPIDSLVQAAGRCNRSFEWPHGTVTIWHLQPTEHWQDSPAHAVYARGLNRITRAQATLTHLLDHHTTTQLSEAKLTTEGVHDYYRRLADSTPGNQELVTDFNALNCQSLQDTSLITTRDAIDVLVLQTPTDRWKSNALQTAFEAHDYDTAAKLKTTLAPLRVSIPTPDDTTRTTLARLPSANPIDPDSSLRLLDTTQHSKFFTPRTGVTIDPPG